MTSAAQLSDQISGSLVDASNLANRLGSVVAVVVLIAAFCIAALLTLSSVAKRVRELGTLKAIGWRQSLVVRQIVGESVVTGILGGHPRRRHRHRRGLLGHQDRADAPGHRARDPRSAVCSASDK